MEKKNNNKREEGTYKIIRRVTAEDIKPEVVRGLNRGPELPDAVIVHYRCPGTKRRCNADASTVWVCPEVPMRVQCPRCNYKFLLSPEVNQFIDYVRYREGYFKKEKKEREEGYEQSSSSSSLGSSENDVLEVSESRKNNWMRMQREDPEVFSKGARHLVSRKEVGWLVCSVCTTAGPEVDVCGRCRKITYCSKECQRQDWPRHKAECQFP